MFIVVGFALIFLEFARDDGNPYGVQIYSTYQMLYATVPSDVDSVSQKLFAALILFLLNVVLLNMLISIMGDSFDKVQQRRTLTDSLTRLEIIQESMTYMRMLVREKDGTRGYLVFCEGDAKEGDDNRDGNEWEGWVNLIKKAIRENEGNIEERMNLLQSQMNQIEEKMQNQTKQIEEGIEVQTKQMEERIQAQMERNHNMIMEALKKGQLVISNV